MSLYCTFTIGRFFLGIPVDRVQEVMRQHELSRVPLAREEIRGLINLRGQIVTAIDLRRRLGLPGDEEREASMSVLVQTAEGAVSLLVDQIEDVLFVEPDTIEQAPKTVQAELRDMLTGASKQNGRILLLLDTDKALELSPR